MKDHQNTRERILDEVDRAILTTDDANVQFVLRERFRVVHKLPSSVRKALNAAVKAGVLGHMKKDGVKPEVYYHPTFKYMAIEERNKHVNALKRAYEAMSK